MQQETLTANKAWKLSGTTLSFKEWIDRENKKKQETVDNFLPFSDTEIKVDTTAIDTIGNDIKIQNPFSNNTLNKNKVLGLDSSVLIFSGVLIVASLTYYIYTKVKNKDA